jgi:hypothetical protein
VSTKKPTVAQVKKWAEAARDEWLEQFNSAEAVRSFMFARLDKQLETIVAEALGFECRYGRWEIRTSRESLLSRHLEAKCSEWAREWLDKNLPNVPDLKRDDVKEIVGAVKERFAAEVEHQAWKRAEDAAARRVEEVVAKVIGAGGRE